jgi:capsular exopolysaccharide synthesis family protein
MKLVSLTKGEAGKPGAKIFMLASARGSNGKTFTAVNLATFLSKSHYKTLLVDLDLRRPSVRGYFPMQDWTGAIDDLVENTDEASFSKAITEVSPQLGIAVGAGTVKEPTEFLESQQMEAFLKTQKEKYDFIILDLPPTLGVVDAMMIAPMVDHIIFVAEHRGTHRADVDLARSILSEVHTPKMLAVINFVHREYTYYDTIRYYSHNQGHTDKKSGVA